jgi:hypothetical protein
MYHVCELALIVLLLQLRSVATDSAPFCPSHLRVFASGRTFAAVPSVGCVMVGGNYNCNTRPMAKESIDSEARPLN